MVVAPVSPASFDTSIVEGPDALSCRLPDPLLLPFLQATNESAAQEILCQLLYNHADPIIVTAVYFYAHTNPGVLQRRRSKYEEDVRSETFHLLMTNLINMRNGKIAPIRNFLGFVKVVARQECLRCLRKASREKPFSAFAQQYDAETNKPSESWDAQATDPIDVLDLVLKRDGLRALWNEIVQLPPAQRDALLLSMRDGNGLAADNRSAVNFFLQCGVVTRKELAAALNLETELLQSLLKQLPFCDCTIAERMGTGLSPEAVKNLRTAARRRLQRRVPFVSM